MPATLLVPPAVEPCSVAEAKSFLRVEHDDDDGVIAALIAAARGHVEALTRQGLITQTWRLTRDGWPPDGRIAPRLAPLRSVAAARLLDEGGQATMLDAGRFAVDAAAGVIAVPRGLSPPGRARGGIALDVVVGFGDGAGDVPAQLRHAVRMLVAHWYENRGLAAIGASVAMLPGSVSALIASYRVLSL